MRDEDVRLGSSQEISSAPCPGDCGSRGGSRPEYRARARADRDRRSCSAFRRNGSPLPGKRTRRCKGRLRSLRSTSSIRVRSSTTSRWASKMPGVLRADRFRDPLLHLENLRPRLDKRRFEAADLVRDLGSRDAMTRHIIHSSRTTWMLPASSSPGETPTAFETRFPAASSPLMPIVRVTRCQLGKGFSPRNTGIKSYEPYSGRAESILVEAAP